MDRRRMSDSSIICENSVLRLRLVRREASMGAVLDARGAENGWTPVAAMLEGADPGLVFADGEAAFAEYYAFDLVEEHGEVRGVTLQGALGALEVALTITLADDAWSQHSLQVHGAEAVDCRQLILGWQLLPTGDEPVLCWPVGGRYGSALAWHPAGFIQQGPYFLALVPDLEEGDGLHLGLCPAGEMAAIECGFLPPDDAESTLPLPFRLSYALCTEARALPGRGFQQVVRYLGARDALAFAAQGLSANAGGSRPALPSVDDAAGWLPFEREGTPVRIAALVARMLHTVSDDDPDTLETALCWLDRLCLQQSVTELPGSAPLGAFGDGPAWREAAPHLPDILLHAFQLTGRGEYACRAIAALNAFIPAE